MWRGLARLSKPICLATSQLGCGGVASWVGEGNEAERTVPVPSRRMYMFEERQCFSQERGGDEILKGKEMR